MPKRSDISSILVLGSGPIVIGQACEFDYSGTQACRVLRREGYRVVLVNSNPATIMTDPEMADATYVEPLTPEVVEKILEKERPDAILPTVGGQTGINLAMALHERGALVKYGVELLGAGIEALSVGEDRELFKRAMEEIGLRVCRSGHATSVAESRDIAAEIGYPVIVRPSFTLGGEGGGTCYNRDELDEIASTALEASPSHKVLIEESVLGWKEFELEVIRDRMDNAIVVCSVENFDAMGVHTGDSITVAPQQTLSDDEYQAMRDDAFKVIRRVGVATGGSNIQFAVSPETGERIVIEMNPRVSRSSALASKATGFPIAKIAALLAVGFTLDEIPNDITGKTFAAFEPTLDYTVVKIPRWAFEKFPGASTTLGTAMKSVGEVMAIGRNIHESMQKALRGLETGLSGFNQVDHLVGAPRAEIEAALAMATPDRLLVAAQALREGFTVAEVHAIAKYDPWFLERIAEIIAAEAEVMKDGLPIDAAGMRRLKSMGFSDKRLAWLALQSANLRGMNRGIARGSGLIHEVVKAMTGGVTEDEVRAHRVKLGVRPVFKRIDTCAAEFDAKTPYMYSTYEAPSFGEPENESEPTDRKKIVILGGGPNRIGQGIEFDYCCCHACFALADAGYETIMVNCNPETVSTDYDTSDRLYFEPLTAEDVLEILHVEQQNGTLVGVIVQFGGQTPLNLARALEAAGIPILGTTPDAIDLAEDRERFAALITKLGLLQPANGLARSRDEAVAAAERIGYPVLMRPSYVLGGRAMEIVDTLGQLEHYIATAVQVSGDSPVLIDQYLRDAIEVDVDAICDGTDVVVAGVLQHIEEAGVHSGDSACSIPPYSLSAEIIAEIERQTVALAHALSVVGLMNIQFAVKDGLVYLIEVNPRASRTVPFVAKAIGVPIAKIAARVMAGEKLKDLPPIDRHIPYYAVKEAVFPFNKFPGVDPVLSPEMKSTGEVIGIDPDFTIAFAKAQLGAGTVLPTTGNVFVSVKDGDKAMIVEAAKALIDTGFKIVATGGTADHFARAGLAVEKVNKVAQGRPHIVDRLSDGDVALVFNTTEGW
ncbi:MAG: carbamoyl-phosphate synthase large subunit, partial [Thermoanaerobaculia bacterium]